MDNVENSVESVERLMVLTLYLGIKKHFIPNICIVNTFFIVEKLKCGKFGENNRYVESCVKEKKKSIKM